MATDASKKVEFIVAWYNKERVNFSFAKQIMLAKTWIDICTKNEEYEMSAALKKEMDIVVKTYLKKKRESRTLKQKVWYFYIKINRKLKI
jgi:hypothetical protein